MFYRPSLVLMVVAASSGLPACTPKSTPTPDSAEPDSSPQDSMSTVPPAPGDILPDEARITEAMADDGALRDGDGEPTDWIELYNDSGRALDLGGCGLSDDPSRPEAFVFPSGTLLVAGEYRLIYASGKGPDGPAGELHTLFSLDKSGETLSLTAPDGTLLSTLILPATEDGMSWGLEQEVASSVPIQAGSAASFTVVPPDSGWTARTWDDTGWLPVTLGIGFDGSITAADPENAALEKPATQSSDGYGYTGAQAVDGDPGTFSHTGDGDLEPWLAVDLDGNWSISQITLMNRDDCCGERLYNLTVSVLDGAGNPVWTSAVINPVSEGAAPTSPGRLIEVTPPTSVFGAAVRIDKVAVNGAGSSEWLTFAEVVVTASAASPYADLIQTDVGTAMAGIASAAFVRAPFGVDEAAPVSRAMLTVQSDDGFTAALNGVEVAALNDLNDVASEAHDGAEVLTFAIDSSLLGADNVLALKGLNVAADDDDFLLGAALTLDWITTGDPALFTTPTPGMPNGEGVAGKVAEPTASPSRGFYDAPFNTTIGSATPGATLVYTLDGSVPTLENGTVVAPADAMQPASAEVRVATTTLVRAAAFREGWTPSDIGTESFVFLNDVMQQPVAPVGAPAVWNSISEGPYTANYEMDPEVVNDPAYTADLLAGLRAIPTLSIVMDPADIFGDDGIYTNSAERGDHWQRAASIELILGDGSTAFQEDVGIEVHGWGWRYHASSLKHSFRLQFSQTFGKSKLDYPWFVDAPVSSFDSIVLRAGGSKTWLDFRDPAQAQYLHDAFARDTARDMGKVDGHATFVHLYLNGLYWGLYDPVERPEAGFGEEYFGYAKEDYDAINRRTVTNEAVDGNLEAYNAMLALADDDLSTAEGYAAIEDYLDVDDLIDYMLIQQYTVNRDGPCCFESNNMRGLRRRADPGTPDALFRFFVWDMEYSLWDASDATNVDIDVPGSISHVYTRLRGNADFRARFATRARAALTGSGALTPAAAAARYAARGDEIFDPLVAESARWGDTYRSTPYTRDVEWAAEYNRLMNDYFPNRTAELVAQLQAAGLY